MIRIISYDEMRAILDGAKKHAWKPVENGEKDAKRQGVNK